VIAAFSMWQAKDARNVKLQTFMVGPGHRRTAIGQHLLYHELRTWARDPKLARVVTDAHLTTVPRDRLSAVLLLERYRVVPATR